MEDRCMYVCEEGRCMCECVCSWHTCTFETQKGEKALCLRLRKSATVKGNKKKNTGCDIGAGKSDFCCRQEQTLIITQLSVCSLRRGERNRVTG